MCLALDSDGLGTWNLASISSQHAQRTVEKYFPLKDVWIGLRYDSKEDSLTWVDGSPFNQKDFSRWQENVSTLKSSPLQGLYCVMLDKTNSGVFWKAENCSSKKGFICSSK
jgi:hypothetical protein